MIVTGKWAYKKYKKRKQDKENSLAADSAHHDEMLNGVQDPALNAAPALLLTSDSSSTSPKPHSTQPPPYTDLAPAQPSQYSTYAPPMPPPSPSMSPAFSSPNSYQQHPAEIAVRGRWVWQPDGPQPPATTAALDPPSTKALHMQPMAPQVAELEPERAPAELHSVRNEDKSGLMMGYQGGPIPIELPADIPSSDDSDHDDEKMVVAELDAEERSPQHPPESAARRFVEVGKDAPAVT